MSDWKDTVRKLRVAALHGLERGADRTEAGWPEQGRQGSPEGVLASVQPWSLLRGVGGCSGGLGLGQQEQEGRFRGSEMRQAGLGCCRRSRSGGGQQDRLMTGKGEGWNDGRLLVTGEGREDTGN